VSNFSDRVCRDLALLAAGLASIAILGGIVLVNSGGQQRDDLTDVDAYGALRMLMAREYAELRTRRLIEPDVAIAVGSDITGDAAEVLRRFGRPWGGVQAWEENRGVPPAGILLVRELRIEGDSGFVTVVVGERAGDLGCGYTIQSRYDWNEGWEGRALARMRVC
jgi:hypothetical protein